MNDTAVMATLMRREPVGRLEHGHSTPSRRQRHRGRSTDDPTAYDCDVECCAHEGLGISVAPWAAASIHHLDVWNRHNETATPFTYVRELRRNLVPEIPRQNEHVIGARLPERIRI